MNGISESFIIAKPGQGHDNRGGEVPRNSGENQPNSVFTDLYTNNAGAIDYDLVYTNALELALAIRYRFFHLDMYHIKNEYEQGDAQYGLNIIYVSAGQMTAPYYSFVTTTGNMTYETVTKLRANTTYFVARIKADTTSHPFQVLDANDQFAMP